jgi:hypothetical protein
MTDKTRHCVICGSPFEAKTAWHRYCGRVCSSRRYREGKGVKVEEGRFCRQCGTQFYPARNQQNKQHCSDICAKISARDSRSKFWGKQKNPAEKLAAYHKKSRARIGPDGNQKRFYRRHPEAPHACEACGEARVLDIAHKPGHERNGSWRSAKNTTPDKVWILCPTCHALLDRMNYTPTELGLVE